MRKRFSTYKAEWSNNREEDYYKKCDEILFRLRYELSFNGNEVYLKSEKQTELLLRVDKDKSKWYEIWLKLKTYIE